MVLVALLTTTVCNEKKVNFFEILEILIKTTRENTNERVTKVIISLVL